MIYKICMIKMILKITKKNNMNRDTRRKLRSNAFIGTLANLLIITLFPACSEQFEPYVPGNGQEAYFNFYNASEAAYQGDHTKGNMIYINDSVKTDLFPYAYPQFSDNRFDSRQFPKSVTSTVTFQNIPWSGNSDVYWMGLPATEGPYRFIFTSVNKTYLEEISLSPAPKSFYCLYLTESPEANDAYTVVDVPVELEGVEGKVKIQVVNLSPDFGAVEVVLADDENNEVETGLPKALGFGQYSPYAEIDTANANKYGQLVCKFRQSGEEEFLLTAVVEAVPGSNYTLVLKGFINETERYIKTSNEEYARVRVFPDPRVHTRRVY